MKKFEGILICTDLDGTLLRKDKSISKENREAIEYFKSEGGKFTFITGRMPFYIQDIYDAAKPNAPLGCINGGGVYDYPKRSYIWYTELDRGALPLVRYIDESIPEIGIQIYTPDKIYFARENAAMKRFRDLTRLPNLVKHYDDVTEPIAKIVFGDMSEEKVTKVRDLLLSHPLADNFGFIRSEHTLFEILPKGIDKGTALKKIAESLSIDIKKTVAVGDYDNDIGMLKAAGLGVAVENATDNAKAVADYVTVSNEEHAIARIILEIESGIIKI